MGITAVSETKIDKTNALVSSFKNRVTQFKKKMRLV